ncbi:hypothetical protein AAL_05303 [Moelleriella libera RCEF 2490]|uniref:Uncharacterized protein n=1 Tax=Moelleriella libera RCEF 2490 TaxID=1081109 RepID=A0A168ATN2_9HYPO|nr:hypothetical protein AAL_05303 [Moelleriella libera RCEF 2490]
MDVQYAGQLLGVSHDRAREVLANVAMKMYNKFEQSGVHAAGRHVPNSTENALDKSISSYTPSIKILAYSQSRAGMQKDPRASLLIATMPTTPASTDSNAGKLNDLPGVIEEKKRVMELLEESIFIKELASPSAAQIHPIAA